jgi:hypothetical protein
MADTVPGRQRSRAASRARLGQLGEQHGAGVGELHEVLALVDPRGTVLGEQAARQPEQAGGVVRRVDGRGRGDHAHTVT